MFGKAAETGSGSCQSIFGGHEAAIDGRALTLPPLGLYCFIRGFTRCWGVIVRRKFTVLHFFTVSNRALMATITVLADINTAPKAGVSKTPQAYNAPAASGMATTL